MSLYDQCRSEYSQDRALFMYERKISQFAWNIKKDYIVIQGSLTYFEMICFEFTIKLSRSRGIKLTTLNLGLLRSLN